MTKKVVKCPNCNAVIFRNKVDLVDGMTLNGEHIELVQGHVVGEESNCKVCKTYINIRDPRNWVEENADGSTKKT